MDFTYVACAYCGHSVVLSKFNRTQFNISPLDFFLLTKRTQSSRGFFGVPGSGKNIIDLMNGSEEEKEIGRAIIGRIKTIYEAYQSVGLIEK